MDDDRWRRLLDSPLDDAPTQMPLWPWLVAAIVAAAALAIGVAVVAGDGDEPGPTIAAPAPGTTEIEEPSYPEPRVLYELAHDPGTGRLILFGGATIGAQAQAGDFIEGTWAYDSSAREWFEFPATPQPPNRTGHAFAYGGDSGLIVMFGGGEQPRTCGISGLCSLQPLGDTWVLDPSTGIWQQRSPTSSPGARFGAAMAYDTESRMLVLFGGAVRSGSAFVNDPFGDTWAYDVAADTWTELAPEVSPPARAWHRMAYDPAIDRILLFGGGAPGGADGLVWAYDANDNNWDAFQSTGPTPRWGGGVAFDGQSRKLVVIGGQGPVERSLGETATATDISVLSDVWLFDPSTDRWEGAGLLDGFVFWNSAAWDPATDRTISFVFGATGSYDVESGAWEWQESPGTPG